MNITENTFAEACFNNNSIKELESALANGPDKTDLETWFINEYEWTESVVNAIAGLNNVNDD